MNNNVERVKDLRIINNFNPSLTVLIDNSPISYLYQTSNGVPIVPFTDNS